jgi:hypothetical protein
MDFAQLDLKRVSEAGAWVQFVYDGEPICVDGKPCRVRVLGMAASGVMEAARKIERIEVLRQSKMARTGERDQDAVLKSFQRQLLDAGDDLIVAAVSEWENIVYDGEPLTLNRENLLKICGSGTLFFEQVRDAIMEKKRLFTNAATGS